MEYGPSRTRKKKVFRFTCRTRRTCHRRRGYGRQMERRVHGAFISGYLSRARGLSSIYPSFPSYPSSKMSSADKKRVFCFGGMKGRKERVRKKRVCSFSRRTRHTRRWDGYDGKSLYEKIA